MRQAVTAFRTACTGSTQRSLITRQSPTYLACSRAEGDCGVSGARRKRAYGMHRRGMATAADKDPSTPTWKRYPPSIDVHTHMYLPSYISMLRTRTHVPRVVRGYNKGSSSSGERLLILPQEDTEHTTAHGRPIGEEYHSVERKLEFMDRHNIGISVISLANPWLDFLPSNAATDMQQRLNDELQGIHESSQGRSYGFGVLAVHEDVQVAVREVQRIAKDLKGIKGVILGTRGMGQGLDDPRLDPLYEALEAYGLVVFVHPHYGVGNEHFAGTGHSLSLALGFPFETTVAISRMILSGVMERFKGLKVLVAHGGGTLPYLAGRLESCVMSDPAVRDRLPHLPSYYLRRVYLDGVVYSRASLKAAMALVGPDRIVWGTDHPFFPPAQGGTSDATWPSAVKNYEILEGLDEHVRKGVLRENALRMLGIQA